MKRFKEVLKLISILQIIEIILFPFLWIISLFFKPFLKSIWLISENPNEACDNGYILFKYIREKRKDINAYYIIKKKSKDYNKVSSLGNVIHHKSFKHWMYYFNAKRIIVTQKYANPSMALFHILHKYNILRTPRVFLQHGITKDNAKMFYYDRCKFRLFICGAKDEYKYVSNNFGYPKENVVYTGFSRFDNLDLENKTNNLILICPTWRNYINNQNDFDSFMNNYYQILNNKELISTLEKNNITLQLVLHKNMSKFKINNNFNKHIKINHNCEVDIQSLLNKASLLITDFSSIFFDIAYREVPIIYYHFDTDEYRKNQLDVGYFSYKDNGFGDIFDKSNDVVNKIYYYINNNFKVEDIYLKRMNTFFERKDKLNSKRILEKIEKIK